MASGRKVDFKNTIIIMTSNIGIRDLNAFGAGIGFSTKGKQDGMNDLMKSNIQNSLRQTFRPEFINRLDDIIVFNSLSKENIRKIVDIIIERMISRIQETGYQVDVKSNARNFIVEQGYDVQYGARPLNRAIQKYIEYPIAEQILKGEASGQHIFVVEHLNKDDEQLNISAQKSSLKNTTMKK